MQRVTKCSINKEIHGRTQQEMQSKCEKRRISVPYFLKLDIRTPARKAFDYAQKITSTLGGRKKVTIMKSMKYSVAKLNISKFED